MKRTIPSLGALLLVLAACAAPGGSPGSSSDPSSAPRDGDDEQGRAPRAILVVDSVGGFVPVEFIASRVPAFVLLDDGRVIMQGAQTLEFPGPALPPLMERTLTESAIQAVLDMVAETQLFTGDLELRGAQNFVADAADTVFILNTDDHEVTVSVYGLGTLMPGTDPGPGIAPEEVQAHRVLGQLNDALMTLDTWLPPDAWEAEGWQPYEPEALRLYVRDVTGQPVDADLPEQVREWPSDDDPAAFGVEQAIFGDGTRCGVVDGELGATWLAELSAATQLTRWTDDGERRFGVTPRPVLPHEDPACPALEGGA